MLAASVRNFRSRVLKTCVRYRTTVVRDRETASRVCKQLRSLEDAEQRWFACDTEVADIDVKKQSPVGNGTVICASIFAGPDLDFGSGPQIWIDNLDEAEVGVSPSVPCAVAAVGGGADPLRAHVQGTLDVFREFFETARLKKVWHNYSFDRHVLYNHGINACGLGGDTMHMARLWDTSRDRASVGGSSGGFSLEALSSSEEVFRGLANRPPEGRFEKRTMKEIFGRKAIKKDGTEGKLTVVPDVLELQRDEQWRSVRARGTRCDPQRALTAVRCAQDFIRYSADDAEVTWWLREALELRLREMAWKDGRVAPGDWREWLESEEWLGKCACAAARPPAPPAASQPPPPTAYSADGGQLSMFDFYQLYMVPFAECLTDMERAGIFVDTQELLPRAQKQAEKDREEARARFLDWAAQFCEESQRLNVTSDAQVRGGRARLARARGRGHACRGLTTALWLGCAPPYVCVQKQQLLFGGYHEKHPHLLAGGKGRRRGPQPKPLPRVGARSSRRGARFGALTAATRRSACLRSRTLRGLWRRARPRRTRSGR